MVQRELLRSMSWVTVVSGFERVAAVLQTILVARALGITEYGVYGLIFGTIGLTASITGLQMGLTATVFVARYRDKEKAKAAFVITFVNRFALIAALLFLMLTIPFSEAITRWLIGSSGSEAAVVVGCLVVVLSVISGVQDGIIQGFEDFRSAALARLATSCFTLAAIYPASVELGLIGAMVTVVSGILLKYFWLARKLRNHRRENCLPARGEGLEVSKLFWGFSFPSVLVSLLVGFVSWYGTVVLSRQTNGFDSLAIVNTGLQWRGPIFLLTSSVSSVTIPAISRYFQEGDFNSIRGLHSKTVAVNGVFSLLATALLIVASPLILRLYGPGFSDGWLVFSIIVASTVPQAVSGVFLQHFVAKGEMWRQLVVHSWLIAPMGIGYVILIPQLQGLGYAITHLVAWTIFCLALLILHPPSAQTPGPLSR